MSLSLFEQAPATPALSIHQLNSTRQQQKPQLNHYSDNLQQIRLPLSFEPHSTNISAAASMSKKKCQNYKNKVNLNY
jgi:hypothetical protein